MPGSCATGGGYVRREVAFEASDGDTVAENATGGHDFLKGLAATADAASLILQSTQPLDHVRNRRPGPLGPIFGQSLHLTSRLVVESHVRAFVHRHHHRFNEGKAT